MRYTFAINLITIGLITACTSSHTDTTPEAKQITAKPEASIQQNTQLEELAINTAEQQPMPALADIATTAQPMVRHKALHGGANYSMVPPYIAPQPQQVDRENYLAIKENGVKLTREEPLSTFSIDVDTAAYSNVRRMLNLEGRLPPSDAVKLEEMVNYFSYDYPTPNNEKPFSVNTEVAPAMWDSSKLVMQIGLQGKKPPAAERPAANLVFLVDVSGSMHSANKLPLLKKSLRLLVNQMRDDDTIALVTYAGNAGLVLDATPAKNQRKIINAIERLEAGGSTHGSAGIHLAYEVAQNHLKKDGINRILIASDGDMNVGTTSVDALKKLIKVKRESGIALTTLGFGSGNYNDAIMEQLADVGNGNAAYIDSLKEAQKVLVNEVQSTLMTIAKDVKIQVEFNPELVAEYRLLGYENRLLQREDFNNDKVDAGEIGAGHTVTALYELTLRGKSTSIDPLRYQKPSPTNKVSPPAKNTDELAFVKLRYKAPNGNKSQLISYPVMYTDKKPSFAKASDNLRFASSVAGFAQLLRNSDHLSSLNYSDVLAVARSAKGGDKHGYRAEFTTLVELAEQLDGRVLSENTQ